MIARWLAGATLLVAAQPAWAQARLGVISYWGPDSPHYGEIPAGSLALVNPDNGVLVSNGQTLRPAGTLDGYRAVVKRAAKRGVVMQGYVPTGYFRHDCSEVGKCQRWERIEAQVKTWFAEAPGLGGIFFDETASDAPCETWRDEYARLRAIVRRYAPNATISFNAGTPSPCAVAAAEPGEIVVVFEHDLAAVRAQAGEIATAIAAAKARGVKSWVLIHTVPSAEIMQLLIGWAAGRGADYVYATNVGGNWQAGDQTWNSLPPYWRAEVKADGLAR